MQLTVIHLDQPVLTKAGSAIMADALAVCAYLQTVDVVL